MFRPTLKTRITADGGLEITDPDWTALPLIKSLNGGYKVNKEPLPGFTTPGFQQIRRMTSGVSLMDLPQLSDEILWKAHDLSLVMLKNGIDRRTSSTTASLLDLKIELAMRKLRSCRICGRGCKVDRTAGQTGQCGLGMDAACMGIYTHIAEEPQINPSVNIELAGCGLQCCFCQKWEYLDSPSSGVVLEKSLWSHVVKERHRSRTISFIGGNPDESLYAILRFLRDAPKRFAKPVVWNANGYADADTYRLLDGIVDVYLPDAKFWNEECAAKLAEAPNYAEVFRMGLASMIAQQKPVIVRILVMPGHAACCHQPMLDFLADFKDRILVNIMGQYFPEHFACDAKYGIASRPGSEEIEFVRQYVKERGVMEP